MATNIDCYRVFGLSRDCTQEQIRMRYHELARKYHPDAAIDKDAAGQIFATINQAYQILRDPVRRTAYDIQTPEIAVPKPAQTSNHGGGPKIDFLAAGGNGSRPKPQVSAAPIKSLLDQARIAAWHEDWGVAEELCIRYLRDHEDSSPGFELLGDIFAHDGRIRQAVKCYNATLKLDPSKEMLKFKIDLLRSAHSYHAAGPDGADGKSEPGAESPAPSRPAADRRKPAPPPEAPERLTFLEWISAFFKR